MRRLENFLGQYPNKRTRSSYKHCLKVFFKHIYGEEFFKNKNVSDAVERYFSENRDYKEDAQSFFVANNSKPPKSLRLLLTILKTFFIENEIELRERFWKKLGRRIRGSRAVSREKIPSNSELRRIIMHLPLQGKALFLTLVSSGMRIGEALQLKLDDIDLNKDPVKIEVRRDYTKSGDRRITFVTNEAKEAIEEWLKNREKYLETAVKKSHLFNKEREDDRLFPFQKRTAYVQWQLALDKAKLNGRDKETKRRLIHPHVLRKFFRSKGGMVSVDMVEALMGHSGYLTDVYRKYPDEEKTLSNFYKKIASSLEVFGTTGEQYETLKKETAGLQAMANRLMLQNISLEERLTKTEKAMKWMLEEIRAFQIEVLRSQGNTPEQIEEIMRLSGSKKEEYLQE